MALADTLRERASRGGRTAQADCGALGVLTVEALPPRECEALARGPDGDRAVFYAACRELQAAGEALRQAGQVFTPDGVMQYVSDREAAAAARTVLKISGVTAAGGTAERDRAGGSGTPDSAGDEAEGPEGQAGQASAPGSVARHVSGQEAAAAARTVLDTGGVTAADGTPGRRPGQKAENRLETVQKFAKQFPEIRPETVQEQAAKTPVRPASAARAEKDLREIRRETVQERSVGTGPSMAGTAWETRTAGGGGQASREFSDEPDRFENGGKPDKKTQSLVEESETALQNVADRRRRTAAEPDRAAAARCGTAGGLRKTAAELWEPPHETASEFGGGPGAEMHETESEVREALHEIKSDSEGKSASKLHETTSEVLETVHDIKSDFGGGAEAGPHETGSEWAGAAQLAARETGAEAPEEVHEIKSDSGGGAEAETHETRSEFGGEAGPGPHEIESGSRESMHEITSELAQRTARLLLEGLRRAYLAR